MRHVGSENEQGNLSERRSPAAVSRFAHSNLQSVGSHSPYITVIFILHLIKNAKWIEEKLEGAKEP